MVELLWRRDELAEQEMAGLGLKFEEREILLDAIDWNKSLENGARLRCAIEESLVEDYVQGTVNGDRFPMIVVYGPNGKAPWIVSGIQRTERVRRLRQRGVLAEPVKFPAYCITSKDTSVVEVFLRSANTGHGGRSSKDERLDQAVFCVRSLGFGAADAARVFKVNESSISRRIRVDDVRVELARAHVANVENLKAVHLDALAKESDERTRRQFGELAAQHLPTGERLSHYMAASSRARTKAAKTRIVREFENELREEANRKIETKKVRMAKPRREKIMRYLCQLGTFLDKGNDGDGFTNLTQLQADSSRDAMEIKTEWKKVLYRMAMICGQ